jgi:GTPase SAR1 family protein
MFLRRKVRGGGATLTRRNDAQSASSPPSQEAGAPPAALRASAFSPPPEGQSLKTSTNNTPVLLGRSRAGRDPTPGQPTSGGPHGATATPLSPGERPSPGTGVPGSTGSEGTAGQRVPIASEFCVAVCGARGTGKSGLILQYIRSLDPLENQRQQQRNNAMAPSSSSPSSSSASSSSQGQGQGNTIHTGAHVAWKKRVKIENTPFMLELRQMGVDLPDPPPDSADSPDLASQRRSLSVHTLGGKVDILGDDARRATAFILVYDVCDRSTFECVALIERYVASIHSGSDSLPPIVLVANNTSPPGGGGEGEGGENSSDEQAALIGDGRDLANALGCPFFETRVPRKGGRNTSLLAAASNGTSERPLTSQVLACFTEIVRSCFLQWSAQQKVWFGLVFFLSFFSGQSALTPFDCFFSFLFLFL